MKFMKFLGASSALCLSAMLLQAQETNSIEQLRKQLQQSTESFEKTLQEHRRVIEDLNRRLGEMQQQQQQVATNQDNLKRLMEARPGDAPAGAQAASGVEKRPWRPTDPIRLSRGQAYVDVGLIGTFAAGGSTARDIEGGTQLGGHDPNQRGFTVQGVELSLAGAVDPYFRANANVLFQIDAEGESFLELEEAYLESQSLPGNLQVRAGQYFTEFGRQNQLHPHSLAFVDSPLVNARFLGPDGLRNPGARLSWLAPTPFYSELFLGVQDSQGETAFSFRNTGEGHHHGGDEDALPFAFRHPDNDRGVRHFTDLLFTPRYALSFELSDAQTVLFGASGAFGPNASGSGGSTDTQIYGVDLTWKWRPINHSGGYPFVTWQTEAMVRRFEAGQFDWDEAGNGGDADGDTFVDEGVLVDSATGLPAVLPAETLTDYGFYSQLLYGFRKSWVAGLRFDYVTSDRGDYENRSLLIADNAGGGTVMERDPFRASRWRLSPNLTWFPSEFSKIRLQYNYDDRRGIGRDHSVWLQFEFLLGAHGAHKF